MQQTEKPDGATANNSNQAGSQTETVDLSAAGQSELALDRQLQNALAKADENYELYLRAKADTENARRRAMEDVAKAHKFGIESFAEALVPVADSLEKALEVKDASAETLRQGVELTFKQLRAAFERGNLTAINPVGAKFDPHKHQAVSAAPASDAAPANHVVSVLQQGWMIADRVLRPALVVVLQN